MLAEPVCADVSASPLTVSLVLNFPLRRLGDDVRVLVASDRRGAVIGSAPPPPPPPSSQTAH